MNHDPRPRRSVLQPIARRAMRQYGLQPDFSHAAVAETNAIDGPAVETASDVRDLRSLLWCSIDNDDSRDLDQLSVAEPLAQGVVKILVAVAGVCALVPKGSAIDGHARTNTTSVYTAAEIFPMLPEKLSTDLTSLNEDEDRLAFVVEMVVAAAGTVEESSVYRAMVRNHAKLAYNGVAAWLDGFGPAPSRLAARPGLDEQLRLQDRVARTMKGLRHQRGALGLQTIEARPVFDGDVLADLRPDEKNRSKEMIEDFMIAANTAVATFLDRAGFAVLRRVLKSPKRWDRIVTLAGELGETLPAQPDVRALAEFLSRRRVADAERFPDLSLSIVKLLGSGEYAVVPPGERGDGHFGLAVKDYAHSTAPNRRFPDLITQRMLQAAMLGDRPPYDDDELAALADHCTQQEDNAAKVERQVKKSAAALLLTSRIGDRFDGIVTGASEKGTWVRITGPIVEGRVVRGAGGLDVGDRVRVELLDADVERGFIDFAAQPGS
jgi:VacB/RNase II family 3'-5' exoribonuclease